jgi:hypothetical protein
VKRPTAVEMLSCPNCGRDLCCHGDHGHLLGLKFNRPGARFFDLQEAMSNYDRLIIAIAGFCQFSPEQIRSRITMEDVVCADSLDIVEFVLELERDLGGPHSGEPPNFA